MVWNGIVPASELTIAPCGLFSVAEVVNHDSDNHWLSGSHIETDAYPSVSIRTNTDAEIPSDAGVVYDGTGKPRSFQSTPFFVEVRMRATTVDYLRDGSLKPEITKQAKAAAQKAVEFELWEGHATQNAVPASTANFLRRAVASGGATVVGSGGAAPDKALYLIEQAIATSPTGSAGVIHMTRDVASALGSRLKYVEKNKIDAKTFAVTRLGTSVVIGSGYTGNGPISTTGAAASATNKWIYVTGGVQVDLGQPLVVDAVDQTINEHVAVISIPAAVYFDPSIYHTTQVTLS